MSGFPLVPVVLAVGWDQRRGTRAAGRRAPAHQPRLLERLPLVEPFQGPAAAVAVADVAGFPLDVFRTNLARQRVFPVFLVVADAPGAFQHAITIGALIDNAATDHKAQLI